MTRRQRITLELLSGAVALWLCWPGLSAFVVFVRMRLSQSVALWWLEPLFYRVALANHEGLPLYPPPGLHYTPPIYNPGLGIVGGALIEHVGEGYPALRGFSLACAALLCVVVGLWTWRGARSVALSIVAVLACVSLHAPMGHWIGAINVDMPSLALAFFGLWLVTRTAVSRTEVLLGGVCITLGFAFKQPACLLAIPALAHLAWNDRKLALWFAIACGGSALLMVGLLLWSSHGWYWTYAVTIPLSTPKRDTPFMPGMLNTHALATYAALAAPFVTWLGPRSERALWLPLVLVAWLMAHAGFTKDGGDLNTLMPAYVAGLLCLMQLPACAARLPSEGARTLLGWTLIAAVAATSFGFADARLSWIERRADALRQEAKRKHPRPPYAREMKFEAQLRAQIGKLPKPVFVGARFFGPRGPLNTHQTGLYEGLSRTQVFEPAAIFEAPLRAQHYRALVVWDYWNNRTFDRALRRHYKKGKLLGTDPIIGLKVHVWHPLPR